jgi:hypothetical protein
MDYLELHVDNDKVHDIDMNIEMDLKLVHLINLLILVQHHYIYLNHKQQNNQQDELIVVVHLIKMIYLVMILSTLILTPSSKTCINPLQ